MSGRRREITRIASIAFATAALLIAGAPAMSLAAKHPRSHVPASTVAAPAPFCSSPIVDNYWAPIERLQPIPALPEGGVLPFAPAGTTLGATGQRGVLVGASGIGFRLTNGAPATAAKPRRLRWIVLERLIRLTNDGRNLHPSGLKRIDLKQLPPGVHRGLTFPIPDAPAIYSLEVTIQNHRGRLLGRYGEYIRVVSRLVEVGITLSAYDKIAPGSYLESCFEANPRPRRRGTHRDPDLAERPPWPLPPQRRRHHGPRRTRDRQRRIRRAVELRGGDPDRGLAQTLRAESPEAGARRFGSSRVTSRSTPVGIPSPPVEGQGSSRLPGLKKAEGTKGRRAAPGARHEARTAVPGRG